MEWLIPCCLPPASPTLATLGFLLFLTHAVPSAWNTVLPSTFLVLSLIPSSLYFNVTFLTRPSLDTLFKITDQSPLPLPQLSSFSFIALFFSIALITSKHPIECTYFISDFSMMLHEGRDFCLFYSLMYTRY